ncbi:MAG: hypothetical protein IPP02_03880 [Chitinophagaceae bacterium]|nr:hypothetical protein [Chitinophagaceae bacterium]
MDKFPSKDFITAFIAIENVGLIMDVWKCHPQTSSIPLLMKVEYKSLNLIG